MAVATETAELSPKESFAALLDESLGVSNGLEGTVVKGRVISIENDAALIDVGLKSEGRVALKEFAAPGAAPDIHVGDVVEVFLERMEDKNGEAQLSRASRSFMSRRTSSYIAGAPRSRNSLARRRARASGLAVTKSFTAASGQTTVPMSRPSITAPFGVTLWLKIGGCAAKSRCIASNSARTAGNAERTDEARATASLASTRSPRTAGETRRAAATAAPESAGSAPASSTSEAVAR